MDPVAVFDPDDGTTWLQTGDAVTITLPVEQKPLVAIHSKHIEIRAADGERSPILQQELSAQDFSKGPGALEKAVSDICYEAGALEYGGWPRDIRLMPARARSCNGAELIIVSDVPRNSDFLSFDVEEGQGMGDDGRSAPGEDRMATCR
eukprot:Skav221680  [mRNA]  locus=scaffold1494:83030:86163:+ [translate_table: standard]